jgi:hypothetical protein
MKVGDLVIFEAEKHKDPNCRSTGLIVAKSPHHPSRWGEAFDILWFSGELVRRCSPQLLEVINESR